MSNPPRCISGGRGVRWRRTGWCWSRSFGRQSLQPPRQVPHRGSRGRRPQSALQDHPGIGGLEKLNQRAGSATGVCRDSQELRRHIAAGLRSIFGCGSIPLEAQRLGLPAFGSDLNPVAVIIGKAMVGRFIRTFVQQPVTNLGPMALHTAYSHICVLHDLVVPPRARTYRTLSLTPPLTR